MQKSTLFKLAAVAVIAAPASARAQLQLVGLVPGTGGGLGAQTTVLTVQSPGNTSTESGCSVLGVGNNATPIGGCSYAQVGVNEAQSQAALLSSFSTPLTGANVRVVFNGAEPLSENPASNTLTGLTLYLVGANGQSTFSTSLSPVPQNFVALPGTGNFGYFFRLADAQQAAFNAALATSTRIGVGASVTNAQGGLETFAITFDQGTTNVIPEPSTYALLGAGLAGVLGIARRRRTNV
jgi:hypothetical protein